MKQCHVGISELQPYSDYIHAMLLHPFQKVNVFGQHLYHSVCLFIYCLFKMLHLREFLLFFSLVSILYVALFSI